MFKRNYWSDYRGASNYTVWLDTESPTEVKVYDINPLITSPHKYLPPKMFIIELSIFLTALVAISVLGGGIIVKTSPQVFTNDKTVENIYSTLIRSGLILLILQNVLILVFVSIFVINLRGMHAFDEMEIITFSLFHLDLLGFILIGIGYIFLSKYTSTEKGPYKQAGLFLLGWVICRILTQYIIPFGLVLQEYDMPLNYQSFAFYLVYRGFYEEYYHLRFPFDGYPYNNVVASPPMILILTFLVAGLLLYIAARTIPQIRDQNGVLLFRAYGMINMFIIIVLSGFYYQERNIIGVFANNGFITQIALLVKVVLIPILGIITFIYMLRESSLQRRILKLEKEGDKEKIA